MFNSCKILRRQKEKITTHCGISFCPLFSWDCWALNLLSGFAGQSSSLVVGIFVSQYWRRNMVKGTFAFLMRSYTVIMSGYEKLSLLESTSGLIHGLFFPDVAKITLTHKWSNLYATSNRRVVCYWKSEPRRLKQMRGRGQGGAEKKKPDPRPLL